MMRPFTFTWKRCQCPSACILPEVFMGAKRAALFDIYREARITTQLSMTININEGGHIRSFLLLVLMTMNTRWLRDAEVFHYSFFLRAGSQPSLLPFPHPHTTLVPRRQPQEPAAQGSSADRLPCPRHSSSSRFSINKPTMSNLVNKACVLEYGTCPLVSYKTQDVRDTNSNESQWLEGSQSHTSAILTFRS